MTGERRAVLLLLGLAVAGQGLRLWRSAPDQAPGAVSLLPALPVASPGAHRDSSRALGRPLAAGERVDVDRAGPAELTRLPRVGMNLAKTIVAWREAHGPFGSLAALDAVPGVGPGLLARLEPHVRFSGTPRVAAVGGGASTLLAPADGPPKAGGPIVSLRTATAEELERLPHIGPGLAARIVAYRERHGAFAAVDSLVRVPGIGPATLARIRDRLAP